ncbi:MAG: DUF2007 domain-containing protein [Myxococcota bacterium]|nr:DUF2007 domain-containing protein [Myxococcota bacterium]
MESLITVASFPMDYQAHSARNFLQEHGVECFLADEHLQDVNWVHSPISGAGVRLQVRESNEEAARNLLTLFERHQRDGDADVDWEGVDPDWKEETFQDSLSCPGCGSKNTRLKPPHALMQLFSVLLLNIPLLLTRPTQVCCECERQWKP